MSAPKLIDLQVPDDCDDYDDAAKGEVSWCVDKINADDVEYVRADVMREEVADEIDAAPIWGVSRYAGLIADWLRTQGHGDGS